MAVKIRDVNRASKKRRPRGEVIWNYLPTPRQLEAHKAPERYKLFGGGMGGGKTVWLCAEAIKLSLKFPGNRGYMCRDKIVDFVRSTLVTFETLCPRELLRKHWRQDRILEFWNGSQILYGALGGEEEIERIKSTEFGFVCIDEATETYREMFVLLASRLRWKLPDSSYPDYHILLASNPEPGWVKEDFVDRRQDGYRFIPSLLRDNPHLPKDYIENLRKTFPKEMARRYLDGSWNVFEGQIYKEFDRERHVFTHDIFALPESRHFDTFRVVDHGYTNPTCWLWVSVDFDGVMWVWDEHYQALMTIKEHADEVKRRGPDWFNGLNLGDPSMFSRTMQKGGQAWSPADEYRENGLLIVKPYSDDGQLSEMSAINLVKQRFKSNTIMIHEKCENTIKEIMKLRWKKLKSSGYQSSNSPEAAVDKDNHAADCLRYACMWRPPSALPPKKPEPVNSLHYAIMKHKKESHNPFMAGWD